MRGKEEALEVCAEACVCGVEREKDRGKETEKVPGFTHSSQSPVCSSAHPAGSVSGPSYTLPWW